ncbi:hypothetical protein, partial [Methylomonas methanica]
SKKSFDKNSDSPAFERVEQCKRKPHRDIHRKFENGRFARCESAKANIRRWAAIQFTPAKFGCAVETFA